MQNIRMAFALLTLCLFSFFSCEKDTQPSPVLSLQAIDVSTGTAVKKSLPGTDLEVSGNGFTMAFFDKITGQRLGYLMDITVAFESFPDGSMKAENYTIFEFEADNSTLVLHNFIEMAPIDASTLEGKISAGKTQYNLISGTGKYAGAKGGSTLKAILDISAFAEGTIGFNCIYNIQINQ